jgi:molybdopterin molybdotransferase
MLDLALARAQITAHLADRRLTPVEVALAEAGGFVLAHDLVAGGDMPGFAHSAMDGYAVRASDLMPDAATSLRVIGDQRAGVPSVRVLMPGDAVLIATGAMLPAGADTVVIRENATRDGERVTLTPGTAGGSNVRGAGEDYARGDLALAAGTRLGPAQCAVLASFGVARVAVYRPRVAVLVTGDELAAPGDALRPGQRYESNGALLREMLHAHGCAVVSVDRVGDQPDAIARWLRERAAQADLLISTGGASMGEADYLPRLVAETGSVLFHRVRMRPGMPVLFGTIGTTPMLVLPGNPVSVAATFIALARPLLAALTGSAALDPASFAVRLANDFTKDHARTEFRRARLAIGADAIVVAHPHASLGSGALRSVAESDALLELDAAPAVYRAGDLVACRRLALD